ncbi:SoxXA-binding protein [Gammaproteobacteria bacterium]|nr:SoxXA-binding protein [Gammaproteobacteria bacterium]
MKTSFNVKLLSAAVLSLWLVSGCASNSSNGGSKANAEATAAIASANAAIKSAKSNDWIWRDTEKFAKEAKAAADAGDNAKAIKLADKARFQAEAAVEQYNLETTHQRGLR